MFLGKVMYDTDLKERKIKFKPRIKSNLNIYPAFTTEIFVPFPQYIVSALIIEISGGWRIVILPLSNCFD